jgi:hypothetical protein
MLVQRTSCSSDSNKNGAKQGKEILGMSRMGGKSCNFDVLIDKLLSWLLTCLFNFLFFSLMMMLLGVATSIGFLSQRVMKHKNKHNRWGHNVWNAARKKW